MEKTQLLNDEGEYSGVKSRGFRWWMARIYNVGAMRRGLHMAMQVPWAAVQPTRAGTPATGVTPKVAPEIKIGII